jgi:hypothetical protein
MTKKPPVERPGVSCFGDVDVAVKSRKTLKKVYYFCNEDELLYRLSDTIHRALVSGELGVPGWANRRQRLLEVQVDPGSSPAAILAVRGLYYPFNNEGKLDLHAATEAVVRSLEGDKPQEIQADVVDIGPALRARSWNAQQHWQPSSKLLAELKKEVEGGRGTKPVPLWHPPRCE